MTGDEPFLAGHFPGQSGLPRRAAARGTRADRRDRGALRRALRGQAAAVRRRRRRAVPAHRAARRRARCSTVEMERLSARGGWGRGVATVDGAECCRGPLCCSRSRDRVGASACGLRWRWSPSRCSSASSFGVYWRGWSTRGGGGIVGCSGSWPSRSFASTSRRQRTLGPHAARRPDQDHQEGGDRCADDDADDELHHAADGTEWHDGRVRTRFVRRRPRPSGGMADTTDSKSVARKGVRVQIPPRALTDLHEAGFATHLPVMMTRR